MSHDQVIQRTKAKVRVCSDSVFCLGKVSFHTEAFSSWEGQVEEFLMSASYGELWESMEEQSNSSEISSQY